VVAAHLSLLAQLLLLALEVLEPLAGVHLPLLRVLERHAGLLQLALLLLHLPCPTSHHTSPSQCAGKSKKGNRRFDRAYMDHPSNKGWVVRKVMYIS
jgi:hypothetical protein